MIPKRTPMFLLANLGAEIQRLADALHKGDRELSNGAFARAQGVFDTLSRMPLRPPERKEIEILREVIEDLPQTKRRFTVSAESLQSYFYPFAHKVLGL
ncbi:MAG: hypothetical protein AAB767_03575 [Patescibacteria group bacterium]